MQFDETQQEAIRRCISKEERVVPITGQAGTGKTTIIQEVYKTLTDQGVSCVLCAPTGKAAKRIKEATGIPAQTIHRLLEYPYPGEISETTGKPLVSTDPKRDRNYPILYKCVLADEYAMVNTEVHRNLFDALPPGGIIRVFGDANQLPPIESNKRLQELPSPFETLLDKFNGVWLETIHRQEEGSSIIYNGNRIIHGNVPAKRDDFAFRITDTPVESVEHLVMDGLAGEGVDFCDINNQIIAPTKQGWVGTKALNALIQGLYQPASQDNIDIARHKWDKQDYLTVYVGDKVIWTVNNYGLELFNGESGTVRELSPVGEIVVDFGDKTVAIPPMQEVESRHGTVHIDPQKDLDLAYVITTHKAQGSEYKNVAYVLNRSRMWTQNRRNFYTAVTRARESVIIIMDQKSLFLSLRKAVR